jgi:hypothetical protein
MLSEVLEHVHERVPHLARRPQQVRVVAPIPDPSPPLQYAVDGAGHPDRESLHPAREPRRCICLHQQMEMIGLNAEVEQAEGTP